MKNICVWYSLKYKNRRLLLIHDFIITISVMNSFDWNFLAEIMRFAFKSQLSKREPSNAERSFTQRYIYIQTYLCIGKLSKILQNIRHTKIKTKNNIVGRGWYSTDSFDSDSLVIPKIFEVTEWIKFRLTWKTYCGTASNELF